MKRTVLIFLLVGTVLLNSTNAFATVTINSPEGNVTFSDVNGTDWYIEHVMILVSEGIISGYSDNTFKPSKSVQVDEFIKTMVVALGYNPGNNPNGYWAQLYIDKALELGFLHSSDFAVYNVPINRGDMAMVCERIVEMLDGPQAYSKEQEVRNNLTDYDNVRMSGSETAILHVYELGIITGYPDGSFGADNQLKRSEASTVIHRIIDKEERRPFISNDIERLASYERDTSGRYRPMTDYATEAEIQAKIDLALGWIDAMYNFDYRTTTYDEYRSKLEWYYSPAISFSGRTGDENLDWIYEHWNSNNVIIEAYGVTDISLPYQSSGSDPVIPVTLYYKIHNHDIPGYTDEEGVWYRQDIELTFIGLAESPEEIDMWPHSFWKFAGEDPLSVQVKVGE